MRELHCTYNRPIPPSINHSSIRPPSSAARYQRRLSTIERLKEKSAEAKKKRQENHVQGIPAEIASHAQKYDPDPADIGGRRENDCDTIRYDTTR
ncbi:hypothetical protein P171DRAFT_434794 [Karstenula rhodostoma CBS 690.94]|uniref:Uncharacterized protein n=1 Tax=Karstenula rhodostoma CBS 690.94 TaxID=1392251 RepID=A0A9P4U8P7_9PLEO|nr:hypothetical protein P171DRAFT_434794 [Karstenula rhodostoma CBS 690.94]